jgi:hypothetical protein
MIRLIQCLCPKRHTITAIVYDSDEIDATTALCGFQALMERLVFSGVINRRCEICDADIEFQWEDAKTSFSSVEEAKPMMLRLEAENAASRAHMIALRRAMKN